MSELESHQELSRSEVADYLREFAAQLDTASPDETTTGGDADARVTSGDVDSHGRDREADSRVTFLIGDHSATIDPPERVTFEVEVDTDDSLIGDEVEHEVEFEISWMSEASESDEEPELDIV